MKSYRRIFVYLSIVSLVTVLVTSCQGSSIGESVEGAIAPKNSASSTSSPNLNLPSNFPDVIPIYRPANLQDVQRSPQADVQNISTVWLTRDSSNQVFSFYRDALTQSNWKTLVAAEQNNQGVLVAQKQDLLLTVSTYAANDGVKILVQYVRSPQLATNFSNSPNPTISSTSSSTSNPQPNDPEFIGPLPKLAVLPSSANSSKSTKTFSDLDTILQALRNFIRDLNQLGVLDARKNNLFEPNASVSRREYARWLVTANNRIYQNRPTRQIRLATNSDQPTFTDVPRNDPDFGTIQGLANAGLVSGAVNPEGGAPTFRPDSQLSREELILWKVPLDLRSPLPVGSVDAVKQAWNFQDTDKISPPALRAVIADAQSGDLSNIRRSFGYTTLFQPQKIVSRAEAAATLWYFGTQSDGLSAQSALEIEKSANNQQPVNPTPSPSR